MRPSSLFAGELLTWANRQIKLRIGFRQMTNDIVTLKVPAGDWTLGVENRNGSLTTTLEPLNTSSVLERVLIEHGEAYSGSWHIPSCRNCMLGGCGGHSVRKVFVHWKDGKVMPHTDIEAFRVKLLVPQENYREMLLEERPAEDLGSKLEWGKTAMKAMSMGFNDSEDTKTGEAQEYDAVTPPHYQRGPRVFLSDYETAEFYDIQCIDVFRYMQDPRLATAFKYIWRVAFGGKAEPWDSRTQEERDARDIKSAIWYLEDYVANPIEPLADLREAAYDALKARLQAAEAKLAEKQAEGKGTQQD
ncbi:hypothetical protein PBI_ROPE_91 [Mycobacterium phage Rope]|uniref:Uncharacterized protein n=1 Tax=Mycobacterium phage Rope TaxID=2767563 RepID=A0A7G9V0E4_9CAUD|nr:hypothetical protein PBI_ROPE_91 [Mycobacterium phage Rope]